jgi:hypothetical protein
MFDDFSRVQQPVTSRFEEWRGEYSRICHSSSYGLLDAASVIEC